MQCSNPGEGVWMTPGTRAVTDALSGCPAWEEPGRPRSRPACRGGGHGHTEQLWELGQSWWPKKWPCLTLPSAPGLLPLPLSAARLPAPLSKTAPQCTCQQVPTPNTAHPLAWGCMALCCPPTSCSPALSSPLRTHTHTCPLSTVVPPWPWSSPPSSLSRVPVSPPPCSPAEPCCPNTPESALSLPSTRLDSHRANGLTAHPCPEIRLPCHAPFPISPDSLLPYIPPPNNRQLPVCPHLPGA